MEALTDKRILITGGCGSIGTQLVQQILKADPEVVRVFDSDEERLFRLASRFDDAGELRYLLGNVRDRDRLEMALEGIDVVFHAAALKHVELNEYNPFEAVLTNVNGTQNLIRMALEEEVESFVGISTDKASNPISVMGATKLLSERLIIAANTYKGDRMTRFGCVRFGNVLGSSGSVIPLFLDQIRSGGPVTVTDPDMTRFMMPVDEATELVVDAHRRMTSGEVFVLKMQALRVGTLAEAMIDYYAPQFDHDPSEIKTEVVGPRPGERIHEKLISQDETVHALELNDVYVILPQIDTTGYEKMNYNNATPVEQEYTSDDALLLSKDDIIELIKKNYPDPDTLAYETVGDVSD